MVGTRGAPHDRAFEVECVLADLGLKATGTGSSRQRAEQEAAKAVLAQMTKA